MVESGRRFPSLRVVGPVSIRTATAAPQSGSIAFPGPVSGQGVRYMNLLNFLLGNRESEYRKLLGGETVGFTAAKVQFQLKIDDSGSLQVRSSHKLRVLSTVSGLAEYANPDKWFVIKGNHTAVESGTVGIDLSELHLPDLALAGRFDQTRARTIPERQRGVLSEFVEIRGRVIVIKNVPPGGLCVGNPDPGRPADEKIRYDGNEETKRLYIVGDSDIRADHFVVYLGKGDRPWIRIPSSPTNLRFVFKRKGYDYLSLPQAANRIIRPAKGMRVLLGKETLLQIGEETH